MSTKDTKSNLSDHINDNNNKTTMSTNDTVSNINSQNVNKGNSSSNNNNTTANTSSIVGNNANKTNKANDNPQTTNNVSPNAPEGSLVIDDIDKKKSLLKEINRIDNWAKQIFKRIGDSFKSTSEADTKIGK